MFYKSNFFFERLRILTGNPFNWVDSRHLEVLFISILATLRSANFLFSFLFRRRPLLPKTPPFSSATALIFRHLSSPPHALTLRVIGDLCLDGFQATAKTTMNKHIKQTKRYRLSRRGSQALLCGAALLVAPLAVAQDDEEDDEIFELSPFTVEGSEDQGYRATSTLAGSRIRTDLKDVGSAISVITEEFLRDTGAVDNQSLLQYTTSTEVGGIGGNFAGDERLGLLNPNANTRVRGLTAADNTRDYFLSDIPWDGYNVNRVDMQRGPNAMLSGLGSPAGLINNTTDSAGFENEGEVQVRMGSYGSTRFHFNVNRVVLEDELAIRVAGVKKNDKYRQEEAWAEDQRFFVAAKFEPKFLKTDSATTTFTANFEDGDIESNRPRTRPPVDRFSGFWEEGAGGYSQITGHPLAFATQDAYLEDGTPAPLFSRGVPIGTINVDVESNVDATDPNYVTQRTVPAYRGISSGSDFPWYGEAYTDGQIMYFANADQGSGDPTQFIVPGINSSNNNVLTVDGDGNVVTDSGGTGMVFYRALHSTVGLSGAARDLGLPLADFGGYGDALIYDRSIFDYKNHLIDGDNKRENQAFQVRNFKVAQTLLDGRLGFEGAMNNEQYNYGQTSPFGWSPGITIDVSTHLGDFSPNPNVGRPVIFQRAQGSSSQNRRERDSSRYTVFGELREGDLVDADSFLGRIIGKQRLTGLMSTDDIRFYEQGYKNWLTDDSYRAYQGHSGLAQNESEILAAVYMGPSVIGTSSPAGLNFQPVPTLNPKGATSIRFWDSNWANPATRNADFLSGNTSETGWFNPWNEQYEAQQDNPNNYTGWTNRDVSILVDTEGDQADLITTARSQTQEVESEAFVWQGYFWDGAIVGLYGKRTDTVVQYGVTAPRKDVDTRNIFDPSGNTPFAPVFVDGNVAYPGGGDYLKYNTDDAQGLKQAQLGTYDVFEGENESKSLVVHLDQFLPELPASTKVSVFWNESSNFQPAETRVNHLNQSLAPPTGETEDYGFLISTFNDKLTLKVNWYETTVKDASFDPGNLWYLGTSETSLFAAGMRDLAFINDVPGWNDSWRGYAGNPYQNGDGPWEAWKADNGRANDGLDQTEAEALEWQTRVTANLDANLAPDSFWEAWGATQSEERWQNGQGWDPWFESTGATPAGFTSTSDLRSEGTEYEVNWRPTDNWNIAINAAQTEAVRDNIAGSLKEWVDARNLVHNGDAGDIRLWWSGDRNNTLKTRWNSAFYSTYQLALQQEGNAVDELREWRFNVVSNYSFKDGKFKGLNVGGSYRWEGEVGIGYPQSAGVTESGNSVVVYDTASPYMGPSEDHFDIWAGYAIDLNDNINWRIQLNVRDVLSDGGLVPLSVNPDGSIREYRIQGDPSWFLTNTFTF